MKKLTSFLAIFASASIASAAVIVSEPFDYSSGTTLGSGTTGGTGWSGGYYSNNGLSTSPTVFGVTNYTWSLPTLPLGSFEIQDKKSVDTTGNGTAYAGRGLSAGINFDADGTYYLSYTMKTASGIGQELDLFAGTSEILSIQYLGGSNVIRMRATDTTNASIIGATAGNDWFLVVKIITSASGDDIFRLNVYEAGDTVPSTEGSWGVSLNGGTITGTVDQIAQWKFFSTAVGIGNLRMTDSYADAVTAVPEPATFALLAGFATLGLILVRRRRQ